MSTYLTKIIPAPAPASAPSVDPETLVEAFLASLSENTLKAYHGDLLDFAGYLGVPTIDAAATRLLGSGIGPANLLALQYRSDLEQRQLASATIRRRLAALRSLVKLARTLGMVPWELMVEAPKTKAYRDTRGPGLDGYRKLLAAARLQRNRDKAIRDAALLRLMGDRGLRRAEVAALDIKDVDFEGERIAVDGKGSGGEREWLTAPPQTLDAIRAWLGVRSLRGLPDSGPLFTNLDRKDGKRRLTASGIYTVLRSLGRKAGVKKWNPHGLRHASITEILNITGGDLRTAQRFARHADPKTTLLYDDNRQDVAGEAARLLAAKVG